MTLRWRIGLFAVLLSFTPGLRAEKSPPISRVAPESWKTPEELMTLGFESSPVVMMNESHNGFFRCPRTRQLGLRVLPAAHSAGARWLAAEALYPAFAEEANRTRHLPLVDAPDLMAQSDMRAFLQGALDLGWTLVAYEANYAETPSGLSPSAANNWRENQQAEHLAKALESLPKDSKMLVWCGNNHHCESVLGSWQPMGTRFKAISGIDPFTIDQGVTVDLDPTQPSHFRESLLQAFEPDLLARGGTAGLLESQTPMAGSGSQDAYIFSLDNRVTDVNDL